MDILFYGRVLHGPLDGPTYDAHLWFNDGQGRFLRERIMIPGEPVVGFGQILDDAATHDFDGDGDLDILLLFHEAITSRSHLKLFANDGVGGFTERTSSWLPEPQPVGFFSALGIDDVNGDGLADVVMAGGDVVIPPLPTTMRHRVLLGTPTGRMKELPTAFPYEAWGGVTDLELADLNGDGLPEAIVTYLSEVGRDHTIGGRNRLYVNTGSGLFKRDFTFPEDLEKSRTVSAADVDGDGLTDLVIGNLHEPSLRLYLQDVRGFRFLDATDRIPAARSGARTYAIAPVDFDRDGDLDLFVGGEFAHTARYLENTGGAHFVDRSPEVFPAVPHVFGEAFGLGDLDGDGDLDTVHGSTPEVGNTAARYLINLERQLKADSTALRGEDYVMTVHAEPQHFVQIGVSLREVRTDLGAFGVLWLDPAGISLTPLLPVNSRRRAEFRIHVPMDPSLRRMRFYVQAIDLDLVDIRRSHLTTRQSVFVW